MANVTESVSAEPSHGEGGDEHHAHPKFLQHHFDTPAQQFDAAKLGMWVFIATEILMFGGLFVAYGIFRKLDAQTFFDAHHALNRIMGASNTIVLLFSSLTAALAVRSAQLGKRNQTSILLVVTILCACAFLVINTSSTTTSWKTGFCRGTASDTPGSAAAVSTTARRCRSTGYPRAPTCSSRSTSR